MAAAPASSSSVTLSKTAAGAGEGGIVEQDQLHQSQTISG